MRRARAAAAASALACALAAPGTAAAAPFVDSTVGGMVFTGPTSAHVSALYWNPAAIGLMRGYHIYLSGQLHSDLYSVDRASIDPGTGEPSNGAGSVGFDEVSDTILTPGAFFGATADFGNESLTVGIAFYAPFMDVQPEGHPELRYHTQGGYLATAFGTLGLSYRVASKWIVGGGVVFPYVRTRLRFAFDEALEVCAAAPCGVENPEQTSDFDIHAAIDEFKLGLNAGVLWKARDDLWIAMAYQSPPGFSGLTLPGEVTVRTSPADGRRTVKGDATVGLALPHTLQLGARMDIVPRRWQLLGSVRLVLLSSMQQLDLRLAGPELRDAEVREWILRYRGLETAFQVEAGIENPAGEATRLGARLRFDSGGVDEAHIGPEQIGGPTLDLAAGVTRALGAGFSVSLQASAGLVVPRSVSDSAFSPSAQIDCVASGYDLDHCEGAREGSAIDTAAGDYQRYNFAATIGISWEHL